MAQNTISVIDMKFKAASAYYSSQYNVDSKRLCKKDVVLYVLLVCEVAAHKYWYNESVECMLRHSDRHLFLLHIFDTGKRLLFAMYMYQQIS